MSATALAEQPKANEVKSQLNVLPPGRENFSITEAGFQYATIHVKQPVGHTVEDALRPEYWVHHARYLKADQFSGRGDLAGSKIELRTLDHAHYAELYVRAAGENTLVVQLLREPVYFGLKTIESDSVEVRWNVGKRGFDIIRKSDRKLVADGAEIKTREMAQDWIDKTLKAY